MRRYRQRWLFAPLILVAAVAEATAALVFLALQPAPPPEPMRLTIRIGGEGEGTVIVSTPGRPEPLGRCLSGNDCKLDVPPNSFVTLTAVRGEKMTFEGWRGCEPYEEDVLSCELMLFRDREISLGFGKVSDAVEVAWVEPTPTSDIKLPALPEPKKPETLEPEKLEEPPVEVAIVKPPPPEQL
ncbi:MAG TPA: hypothetical protein VM734_20895, partial [Kofleriaceae bacterium]|nr:hypothetical protein [Kofleriaceae bacterium]